MKKAEPNNWNEKWYAQLRKQACYVLRKNDTHCGVSKDELINFAWVNQVRRIDEDVDTLLYTRRIRCAMYYYIKHKASRLPQCVRQSSVERGPFDEIDANDFNAACCKDLNTDDQLLLDLRFQKCLTLEQIGDAFSCSRETIRQRLNKIMKCIRGAAYARLDTK